MNRFWGIACLVVISLGLSVVANAVFAGPFDRISLRRTEASVIRSASSRKTSNPRIAWTTDLKKAHAMSVQTGRPMVIVFGADWCGFCKKMDRETFSDPRMVQLVQKKFIPVHLDFDKDKRAAEILKVKSLPTTIVLSSNADLLGFYKGYAKVDKMGKQLSASLKVEQQLKK